MSLKIKVKRLTGLLDQTIGLMGAEEIYPVYFETRFGIHTAFVKHPILVVIINAEGKVYRKKVMKPWRLYFWNPKYYKVLELPVSFKSKIKIGYKINITTDS
jgi:uncharacterized membrane protein (UPF0127 family)